MTTMKEIDELARQLVLASPTGISSGDVKEEVLRQMPDANDSSVSARISRLRLNFPDIIRVRRGVLGVLGHATPDADSLQEPGDEPTAEGDEDDLEGGDEAGFPGGFSEYPIDSLMIRHESRTVHDVLRRIDQGQFVLDPDFQRAFVWNDIRQSRLIESALMRIPLPVMYLAEDADGKLVVVDGLQRLTTFQRFIKNKQALALDHAELKGKRFRDLAIRLQNRIEDTQLILYVIDAKVPERVRLDIFERVNGGVPLSRQQMRNCLYNGPSTRWLREQVEIQDFQQLFSGGNLRKLQKSMRDRELVNRYVAFRQLGWSRYRGDMDAFLGDALRELNRVPAETLATLACEFDRSLRNNILLFNRMAFRRHDAGQTKGSRFNVALFDIYSVELGRYDEERVSAHADSLREQFYALQREPEFLGAVSYGTNQRDRVTKRFERLEAALREVLGDP